ncbi:MAG: galactokinase, partial [Spirochaetota bacterium]
MDYNGGLVFPCAIGLGTAAAVSRRADHNLRLYSQNFPELGPQIFALENFSYKKERGWFNYPLGMAHILQQHGLELNMGLDIVFLGNLPTGGSGLSSSASLEVLTGYILQSFQHFALSRENLAILAQKAENDFCGVNCGIMDQFIIAVAEAQKACLLDCATLEYEQVPLELDGHAFLIANTKLPRQLRESKYNERRSECDAALAILRQNPIFSPKNDLCSLKNSELPVALETLKGNETLQRRVRHVVSENIRTRNAATAMQTGDWNGLGNLLHASHASLRDDYEVSGEHLDTLVSLLGREKAVLGARMTGAGFGGCSIALVKLSEQSEELQSLQNRVCAAYYRQFGWEPEFYVSHAAGGVR